MLRGSLVPRWNLGDHLDVLVGFDEHALTRAAPSLREGSVVIYDSSLGEPPEGVLPEGEYGAGRVEIFDNGTYEIEKWLPDRIIFSLDGSRLKGRYCMIRFKKAGEKSWLLFAL